MDNPTDNLKNALVPVGKGNEDLVDELIDERILRILGLEDNFDIDYGTYKSLLKEQSVLISTGKSKIPREEEMLIQEEFKRIKTKVGRFIVKQKKLTVDNIKFSKSSISSPQKQISGSADTKSSELKSSPLQDIQKALDDIIKSLIDQNKIERKNSENQRKKRENSKRAGVESGLEKGFGAVQKVAEKVIAPIKSILDRIINFFVTLLVGRAIYLLIDWIGKKENQNKLNSVIRFFSDHWPKLLALYLTFGTGLGKFVGFLSKVIIGGSLKLAQLAATLLAKAGVGKAAGVAKFLGGKNGKLLGAGLGVVAAVGTTMLAESAIKNVAGVDKPEEQKTPGYSGGGSVKIPKFAGGGLNFKGMMGGAGMGAMFGPMGMLLGGALGSGKPQEMVNGFVSGEKGVDKVPAMLTDGEFVMSTGAVRKYGVDTLEGMNAAGGGTNKPKMMNGKTYAAGGGLIFGDSIASGLAGRQGGNQVLSKDSRGMSMVGASPSQVLNQLQSYGKEKFKGKEVHLSSGITNNNSDLANVEAQLKYLIESGAKIKLLGVTNKPPTDRPDLVKGLGNMNSKLKTLADKHGASFSGGFSPSSDGIHPASYSSFNYSSSPSSTTPSSESSASNSEVSSGMEFSSTPSSGGESIPSYSEPSSNLEPKKDDKKSGALNKPPSWVNPAMKNDPERGNWQYEYYEKQFKKIREQLAIQRILSSGKGIGIKGATFGLDMGKGFGTTFKNRQSIIVPGAAERGYEPEINIGGMRYFGQVRGKDVIYSSNFAPRGRFGGGIKGGLGLKDQSYKDSPKTQMMTDDKGIPFVGYKSMRNGKLVYERRKDPPRPGTGTSNPLEAFGRAINPGAYKDNDTKLATQKSEMEKRVAATNSLESLHTRGASTEGQKTMMKQIGANFKQTQNDLTYRKNEQIKYAKKVFLTPGSPTQQKPYVFFVPTKTKPKSAFTVPKSQSTPGFSASHPSGNSRNANIYGLK